MLIWPNSFRELTSIARAPATRFALQARESTGRITRTWRYNAISSQRRATPAIAAIVVVRAVVALEFASARCWSASRCSLVSIEPNMPLRAAMRRLPSSVSPPASCALRRPPAERQQGSQIIVRVGIDLPLGVRRHLLCPHGGRRLDERSSGGPGRAPGPCGMGLGTCPLRPGGSRGRRSPCRPPGVRAARWPRPPAPRAVSAGVPLARDRIEEQDQRGRVEREQQEERADALRGGACETPGSRCRATSLDGLPRNRRI